MRTFGLEEELLLVNEATGVPTPVASSVLASARRLGRHSGSLEAEMHQEMIEAITQPATDLPTLVHQATALRGAADEAARSVGARAVALGASPLSATPHPTTSPRYQKMMATYGALPRHSLACALHVHVGIASPEEGVAVLDRIRVWLPVLVALSANSPFCDGKDTGHASWRTMAWNQWPNAGPTDVFESVEAYRELERCLIGSGVLLDSGMLYFAARLSRNHPTLEVRVSDVPLDIRATATVAALVRALVDTAAQEWRAGATAPAVPTALLRLASWQAALDGVCGNLLDPLSNELTPGRVVIAKLLTHVRKSLAANGDTAAVVAGLNEILQSGTGSDVQRRCFEATGDLREVVRAAAERTITSTGPAPLRLPEPPLKPRDRPALPIALR